MGENTGIAWTHKTYNPWIGCTKVSPGCSHCYAEDWAVSQNVLWGVGKPRKQTTLRTRNRPLAWDRTAAIAGQTLVFCASLSDWLDPEVPAEWLADLLRVVAATKNLTWQLLSKRPELWRARVTLAHDSMCGLPGPDADRARTMMSNWLDGKPPANVWVGTTVEDQTRADIRIPALEAIPAVVRFLSCEPLIGGVDLNLMQDYAGDPSVPGGMYAAPSSGIGWVIVGGESGDNARPFDLAWARSLVRQCQEAGVAVFVKQYGDNPQDNGSAVKVTGTGKDPSEWEPALQVREMPRG